MIDLLKEDISKRLVIEKLSVSNLNGSFCVLSEFEEYKAFNVNTDFMACRLISVDADIEHNPNVIKFYEENGFTSMKSNIYKRKFPHKTKTVGMWKDIF